MSHSLDPIALSALLSSCVCHDLINPVGAIGSGLEVFDDPAMDAEMREDGLQLARASTAKAIALLKYARLAYGAAGGYGAEIKLEDAHDVLAGIFKSAKAELDWRLAPGMASKDRVKALLILVHAAADCAPRGGRVTVTGDETGFKIAAQGPKLYLNEAFVSALRGETEDLKPKFTPAFIVGELMRAAGGGVSAARNDKNVEFIVNFSGDPAEGSVR